MLRNGKQTYIPQISISNCTWRYETMPSPPRLFCFWATWSCNCATPLTLFWKFLHPVRTTRYLCTEQVSVPVNILDLYCDVPIWNSSQCPWCSFTGGFSRSFQANAEIISRRGYYFFFMNYFRFATHPLSHHLTLRILRSQWRSKK